MVNRLRKAVAERSGRGDVAAGDASERVPDGQSQKGADSPAQPTTHGRRVPVWLPSVVRRFREIKPGTLGIVLALLAFVFAAVVAGLVFHKQRRAPEYTGVFDAQPQQEAPVEQQDELADLKPRDEGVSGLAESPPPASESTPLPSPAASLNDANRTILDLLPLMPRGGGAEASSRSLRDLEEAIQVRENELEIKPAAAQTTYSSGATYLVFLQALQSLLPPSTISGPLAEALAVKGQPDGIGVWGRWNANGPGIACLFYQLGLGSNFTSFDDARAGDFMKAFFVDAVGRHERSLSMIYLGREQRNGKEMVRVWSSMKPLGYGEALIPRSGISFAIFSRLENPANITRALRLPSKDNYLAGLLTTDSSKEEAMANAGVH